jgi:hypothetical protein
MYAELLGQKTTLHDAGDEKKDDTVCSFLSWPTIKYVRSGFSRILVVDGTTFEHILFFLILIVRLNLNQISQKGLRWCHGGLCPNMKFYKIVPEVVSFPS